jgi:MFS family permease
MTNRWVALTIIFLSFIQFTLNWFNVIPTFHPLIEEMHLTFPQIGVIVGAFVAGYGLAHIPGGWLSERYGMRAAILVGILVETLGALVSAWAPSYGLLLAGRFLCGVGGSIYLGGAVGLTTAWFRERELVLANGLVTGVAFTVGAAIGLFGWTPLVAAWGWRDALLAGAGVGLVTLAMMLVAFPVPPNESGEIGGAHLSLASLKRIFTQPILWVVGFSFLGAYGAYLSAAQLLPHYAQAHLGASAEQGELLSVFLLLGGIPGGFIGGWIGDKFLGVKGTLLLGLVIEGVALLMVPYLNVPGLIVVAGAVGCFGIISFVTWISLPGKLDHALHISDVPTAVGLMLTIIAIGGAAMPPIYSQIVTNYGSDAAWWFLGLATLIFAIFALFTPASVSATSPALVNETA